MPNTEWQLGGNAAERYEEFLVPVIFEPWARALLSRAGLKTDDRLLDLACGTGIVSRLAAAQGIAATGGDINPGMLAEARKRADDSDITFVEANAVELPFADETFDAILCQQGLQFFPDKAAAARECHRVLQPGGQAIFCTARSIDENPLMYAQVHAIAAHFEETAANAIRAVCGFPEADANRKLFDTAGFAEVSVETVVLDLTAQNATEFVDGLLKSTPVADRIAELEPAGRTAMRQSVLDAFGACYDGTSLRFRHSANVVVARRAG